MQKAFVCCLLLLCAAPALAQVQVEAHLEKIQYLAEEPIVVVVDVRNVGDEPVGSSKSEVDVRLVVSGAERRAIPNIFGCFSERVDTVRRGIVDHPRLLKPGEMTSFRYLLKEYDLGPGTYSLAVSGRAGVRWNSTPSLNVPLPPGLSRRETDPVPGAEFERTL